MISERELSRLTLACENEDAGQYVIKDTLLELIRVYSHEITRKYWESVARTGSINAVSMVKIK